ncbi:hypothetical protein PDIG_70730 [Penicillium digitatum PHI26]|uniref:Uncharacterized protein n=2 Tax=Penicillium digitatum TaxID=36651 RepID=K9FII7_PEND2|nr:hypothetical protein PDIP_80050 [Penicillium digitatum Pd1]EKV06294.1 hypothetical protein PDIP_80050 [Penicillium digitatum Pd1]EKV07997.1 hypothetical protein PDIG_70730 [Penicillium digitatum PHI26]
MKDSLSAVILLSILECLSRLIFSPLPESPCTTPYSPDKQHHYLRLAHRRDIHPAYGVDIYTALDAQNLPQFINSGAKNCQSHPFLMLSVEKMVGGLWLDSKTLGEIERRKDVPSSCRFCSRQSKTKCRVNDIVPHWQ